MKATDSDAAAVCIQARRDLQGQSNDRATLAAIARRAMIDRGLEPEFTPAAQQELAAIGGPAAATDGVRDLRDRLWTSIDNDESHDLDRLLGTWDLYRRTERPRPILNRRHFNHGQQEP